MAEKKELKLTALNGKVIYDDNNSETAGEFGPVVLQDSYLIEKLQKLNREKVVSRPIFDEGAGAFGYFELTDNMSQYCKAKFLQKVGTKTPVLVRFSDMLKAGCQLQCKRDIRGFQVKFYTEEGNFDVNGQNLPVTFIRDAIKLPDFIHALSKDPISNLRDPNRFWDFMSLSPETLQAIVMLFSERGIPASYREMNGYGVHTYKWVNSENEQFWIKLHFKSEQGVANVKPDQICQQGGLNYAKDLYEAIEKKNYPVWTVYAQIMPGSDAFIYRWDTFDSTKVWPHRNYPLIKLGRIVLNKNPSNYFQDIEQSAFLASNLVPGIEPSIDKLFQGKLFADQDQEMYRLGSNFDQLDVNKPKNTQVVNTFRNGQMSTNSNYGNLTNYNPNSFTKYETDKSAKQSEFRITGLVQSCLLYTSPSPRDQA
eukprot:TRINITY_DN1647_c0_g1_i2.p1 TRINITY_DN1647_c0_g1~~TRINITY_DN1647_c0_g1_i2.p1  ORF type:complete len:424 (-),score=88.01 TRINITY_DN1647_c0_g1_i2:94-1365(-)